MTTDSIYAACWNLFWILALETLLVFGLTALGQRSIQSALWRRSLWQISILALSVLILLEATGWGRGIAGWAGAEILGIHGGALKSPATFLLKDEKPPPTPAIHVSQEFRRQVAERMQANKSSPSKPPSTSLISPRDQQASPGPLLTGGPLSSKDALSASAGAPSKAGLELSAWWLGPVWLLGTAMVAFRAGCARLLFFLFHLKNHSATEPALLDQVKELAQHLGLKSGIRVIQSAGLQGPIAFGIVRPTIGLPSTFVQTFTPAQQEAVLCHELSHLAARDPAWYLLADLVTAVLWWHPLAWWARRQFHATSEMAADEASLVLRNGPHILAECLVEFGRRLPSASALVWLRIEGNGFRSSLGCRVERLLRLPGGRGWQPPGRISGLLARTLGSVVFIFLVTLCTAWAVPQATTKGESPMKSMQQNWKRSLAAFALMAALAPAENVTPAENPAGASASGPVTTPAISSGEKNEPVPVPPDTVNPNPKKELVPASPHTMPYLMDPQMAQRYGLIPAGSAARYGFAPQTVASSAQTPAVSKGRQEIQAKLEEIVMDQVSFDGIVLAEVIRVLQEYASEHDPTKKGINFLLVPGSIGSAIDPTTGARLPRVDVDLASVPIGINPPLRNIRLWDVLDVITKVAEQPIKYTLEDYGVVFSVNDAASPALPVGMQPLPSPPEPPLSVRTFRVDQDSFFVGLESTFGISVGELASKKQLPEGDRGSSQASEARTKRSRAVQGVLRQLFTELGLNMDPPKNVFYNDLTGILMVRASVDDLDLIQAAVETLGGNNVSSGGRGGGRYGDGFGGGAFGGGGFGGGIGGGDSSGAGIGVSGARGTGESGGERSGLDGVPNTNAFESRQPSGANNEESKRRIAGALAEASRQNGNTKSKTRDEFFFIGRQVNVPGRYLISKNDTWSILDAIGKAGGLTKSADDGRIELKRKGVTSHHSLRELIEIGREKLPIVEASDQIFVRENSRASPTTEPDKRGDATKREDNSSKSVAPSGGVASTVAEVRAGKRTVFVLGQVNNQGTYEIPAGQTWRMIDAISAAGGLTKLANENKIELTRKGKTTAHKFEELRKAADPEKSPALEPGDIVFVREMIF